MKKMTLADKLAKKTFESDKIQQTWRAHMQVFGPILGPAFAEDYQSRIHLGAALNFISRRELDKALKKLQPLQEKCENDADKAAWLFFMGLIFEFAGITEAMVDCYRQAGEYGHRFYLPYMKLAKAAHMEASFDMAAENYALGIDCLREGVQNEQSRVLFGSAYANYAAVLVMMHREEEARAMLKASAEAMPVLPGRSGTEAVMFALDGNWEKADAAMAALETEAETVYADAKKSVDGIRDGSHPQFFVRELDEGALEAFWVWFAENEGEIAACLAKEGYGDAFALVQPKLRELFPFMEKDLDLAFQPCEDGIRVIFADYHALALRVGYEKLLAMCPDSLENPWIFVIEH